MIVELTRAAIVAVGGAPRSRPVGGREEHVPPRSLREVSAELVAAKKLGGVTLAVLVGGEPMTRADLPRLLALARRLDLQAGMLTDGLDLRDPPARSLLIQSELRYLRVPLHGPDAATHDRLSGRSGSFDAVLRGLGALLAEAPPSMTLDVALTLTAAMLDGLDGLIAELVALERRARLGLRLVLPLGALDEADRPDDRRAADAAAAALTSARLDGEEVSLTWEGLAPCLMPESLAGLRDETLRWGAPWLGPAGGGGALPRERPGDRSTPAPCQDCAHLATCPGAPARFVDAGGAGALRPSRAVRANSFNFEHVRELPRLAPNADRCPVLDVAIEAGRVRELVVIEEDHAALYHCPTADFDDEQIRYVKEEVEQLYADRSTDGAALEDFTTGVRRARSHPECAGCAARDRCRRAYVVDHESEPFAREERWLRKEVSRLRGRVLDVGCGEGLYRDVIDRLIREGLIEYHGLDPDADALERLRAAGCAGTLHHGDIESFEHEPGWFDYVLALRSFNHLRDLDRAFTVITRLLRPEGQLVLCDSPVFGMLRTPAQVAYADRHARVGHEHFRNWTSHQVVALLQRYPLRLDVHRPVSRKTSNEWILKYMRAPDGGRR